MSYANSAEPDQTPRFAASDLGLHCLPILGINGIIKEHTIFVDVNGKKEKKKKKKKEKVYIKFVSLDLISFPVAHV